MELVDIYNNKHEKLNYTKNRKELIEGEFRLSCFVWVVNENNQILVQQRTSNTKKMPNMWGATAGGILAGETRLGGTLTEIKEGLVQIKELMIMQRFGYIKKI